MKQQVKNLKGKKNFHSLFSEAADCFYCCSRVNLSHTCDYLPSAKGKHAKGSIPFALNAHNIALLPSVAKQLESNITTTPKQMIEAITTDVPVCEAELQHL